MSKDLPDTPKGRRAEKLRTRRERLGLTQTEVADVLGLSRPGYGLYESAVNDPSLDQLTVIAAKLGVGVGYFFEEENWRGPAAGSAELKRIDEALPEMFDQNELATIAEAVADLPPLLRHTTLARAAGFVRGIVDSISPRPPLPEELEEE